MKMKTMGKFLLSAGAVEFALSGAGGGTVGLTFALLGIAFMLAGAGMQSGEERA